MSDNKLRTRKSHIIARKRINNILAHNKNMRNQITAKNVTPSKRKAPDCDSSDDSDDSDDDKSVKSSKKSKSTEADSKSFNSLMLKYHGWFARN